MSKEIITMVHLFVKYIFVKTVSGCGEIGPLKDANYKASTAIQPPRFARLNTSNPGASKVAWCRDLSDKNGYLQIDLGMLEKQF